MLLITGGLGYIASHITLEYHKNFPNENIILIDNLGNSSPERASVLSQLTNNHTIFIQVEMTNINELQLLFSKYHISKVIHCAGWKAVGESVKDPLKYYHNNLISSINLLQIMNQFNCRHLVFSSSATIYGIPIKIPINEEHPIQPNQPYGETKAVIENFLKSTASTNPDNKFISLRYFNPTGAHPSGQIPEIPNGYPNNLFPAILATIKGNIPHLNIYASPNGVSTITPDGTGIRDYLHVCDLAKAHIDCLNYMKNMEENYNTFNFGTGKGLSVKQIIHEFEKQTHQSIPKVECPPRNGDVDVVIADPSKWLNIFGWIPQTPLHEMVKTALL